MRLPSLFFKSAIVLLWVLLLYTAIRGTIHTGTSVRAAGSRRGEIHIYAWPETFPETIVEAFTKETGIRVRMHYYETNEELLLTLQRGENDHCDLIVPSDYMVEILAEEGLIKPLDRSRLRFFSRLHPFLLNRSYDPGNLYSIPYEWDVFGIGFDKDYFSDLKAEPDIDLFFAGELPGLRLCMRNCPVEMSNFVAHHLYGSLPERLDGKGMALIVDQLRKRRRLTEAYTDMRADYL
ncbi:MAG: extracellular solute-binding protein, partial [Simkaniaceae bacterium]|nr:extracellular solute-binding protein [Simkaniaceae bacterium]